MRYLPEVLLKWLAVRIILTGNEAHKHDVCIGSLSIESLEQFMLHKQAVLAVRTFRLLRFQEKGAVPSTQLVTETVTRYLVLRSLDVKRSVLLHCLYVDILPLFAALL